MCAADEEGLLVSLIQTNFQEFGSGLTVPGWGINLQNRGCSFSLDPSHANVMAPSKRTLKSSAVSLLRGGAAIGIRDHYLGEELPCFVDAALCFLGRARTLEVAEQTLRVLAFEPQRVVLGKVFQTRKTAFLFSSEWAVRVMRKELILLCPKIS